MTEGQSVTNENRMCMRMWLEVGHTCTPRRSLGRSALDWKVWVRGASGLDISPLVQKVVFYLSPSTAFFYPKRVLQEPPYEIQESGNTSLDIPIYLYLKHESPRRIKLKYSLRINDDMQFVTQSSYVYYDFPNPSRELLKCLMNCGGEVVARTSPGGNPRDGNLFIIEEGERRKHRTKESPRKKESPRTNDISTTVENPNRKETPRTTESSIAKEMSEITKSPRTTQNPATKGSSQLKETPITPECLITKEITKSKETMNPEISTIQSLIIKENAKKHDKTRENQIPKEHSKTNEKSKAKESTKSKDRQKIKENRKIIETLNIKDVSKPAKEMSTSKDSLRRQENPKVKETAKTKERTKSKESPKTKQSPKGKESPNIKESSNINDCPNKKESSNIKERPVIKEIINAKKDLIEQKSKKRKREHSDSKMNVKKLLKKQAMMKFELGYVANMCCALNSYEKLPHALVLPPLSNPIYNVPELPYPLRLYMKDVNKIDYALL